ncbi:MAG: DNA breaking-rejoining protein [Prevotella pallens]|uniref:DNA breaking-rejoining protein n=1 Tax=Prevotella pallens TaxID=60133 RepID=UPI001CB1ED50|nr:DNA breaking-rejoining protein [Prevotella pallens]MBF1491469.1 DNA breaking-rejoining protein [Prevotella pallens]
MSKYILQKSTQPNKWVLTDTTNKIVVTFENGAFNSTQKVTMLDDTRLTANELAKVMREMGEWVVKYHGSKCFNVPYGIEYSEDEAKCYLYRRKSPKWRLEIQENIDKKNLADSLRKAAEWLTKR